MNSATIYVPFPDIAGQTEFVFHRTDDGDHIFSLPEPKIIAAVKDSQQGYKDSINLFQACGIDLFYSGMQHTG